MKRIIIILFIFIGFNPINAQDNELINKFAKQAVEIDSLKKVILLERENFSHQQLRTVQLQGTIKTQQDSLKNLKTNISQLENLRGQLTKKDLLIKNKGDSIQVLKLTLSEKDNLIKIEQKKGIDNAKEEKEKGRNEILDVIQKRYKNISFDEALRFSTHESVQIDIQILGKDAEILPFLSDLMTFLSIEKLLENKFDPLKIKNAQIQLSQIKSESILDLKADIDNYQIFTEGLKETIEKIIALDQRESVEGMSEEVRNRKLNKILSEISLYTFNYDYKFPDYPYLSDIIFEILKRKQPNPDAEILDLLKKL